MPQSILYLLYYNYFNCYPLYVESTLFILGQRQQMKPGFFTSKLIEKPFKNKGLGQYPKKRENIS